MLEPVCTTFVRTNNFIGLDSFHLHLFAEAHKGQLFHSGVKQSVDYTTLSNANKNRDWHIFADFEEYLIGLVRLLYSENPIPIINIDNDFFALDSMSIYLSINLFTWANTVEEQCACIAVQMRSSIPEFIRVADSIDHDCNVLDVFVPLPGSIYLMDKAYVDFEALYRI